MALIGGVTIVLAVGGGAAWIRNQTWPHAWWLYTAGVVALATANCVLLFHLGDLSEAPAMLLPASQRDRKEHTLAGQTLIHCGGLSWGKVLGFALVLALAIELFTIWARFGLGLAATRDTGVIGHLTFGLRIHHGYVGFLLAMLAWLLPEGHSGLRNLTWMVAIALMASDLLHHVAVLWPITGSPEFDLVYPRH